MWQNPRLSHVHLRAAVCLRGTRLSLRRYPSAALLPGAHRAVLPKRTELRAWEKHPVQPWPWRSFFVLGKAPVTKWLTSSFKHLHFLCWQERGYRNPARHIGQKPRKTHHSACGARAERENVLRTTPASEAPGQTQRPCGSDHRHAQPTCRYGAAAGVPTGPEAPGWTPGAA